MNQPAPLVLVVDDDADIRNLLARYLTQEGWSVALASQTNEAEDILGLLVPEVVVLDIMMPGESGIQFARRLRSGGSRLPLLLLSAKGSADDRIEGLEAGASDYLSKPFDPRELLLRLRNLAGMPARSAPRTSTAALYFGPYRFQLPEGPLSEAGETIRLTEMETRLLAHLAARVNSVVEREALLALLGGGGENERQVDVLVARLRRKIGTEPLQTVRGQGYRLRAESEPAA